MSKKYKIYKRTVHEDRGIYISFGTEEDVKDWKREEQEWIEQDLGVGDDTIEALKITSTFLLLIKLKFFFCGSNNETL